MTEPRIQLLEDLGAEFERIAGNRDRQPRRRVPSLGRRTPLLVGLLIVALAGGALAALDVLPVGTELPAESLTGSGEPEYTSPRTVVATGRSPGGDWLITVTQSDQGRCIGLQLDTRLGKDMTDICGGPASFDVASVGGGDVLPDTRLVFGPAPEEAAKVRVTAPGGFDRIVPTYDGPSTIEGNAYLVQLPRKGLRNALVNWVDKAGHAPLPGLYVPSTVVHEKGPAEPQRPN